MLAASMAVCVFFSIGSLSVSAQESSRSFDSDLPAEFSYEVSLDDIETDLENFMNFYGLDYQYGTDEYAEFLTDLATTNTYDFVENDIMRYYKAYASVYLGNLNTPVTRTYTIESKTIGAVREENEDMSKRLDEQSEIYAEEHPTPVSQTYALSASNSSYNIAAAQDYAFQHAIIPNLSYPIYPSDCTNFASQILVAGGFSTDPNNWYYDHTYGDGPFINWVNAAAFCEYWSLMKGHLGRTLTSVNDVNNWTLPGDFLSWKNTDTYEIYHTQFVQNRENDGCVYCTQHTPNYYNVKFESRVSDSDFNTNLIYQIDFARK